MKQLKGFVFVITGLFVMITLVSLLMPSKVMTVRSVVVHADPAFIFAELSDLNKWKDWHPVFMEKATEIVLSNPSTGENAYATWNSGNSENKLQITEVNPTEVKIKLVRSGEKDVANILSVNPVKDSSAVQLEWRVLTTLKWYPWEKFYGIFVDKITGPGYELALNNLKELAENRKVY